jgi:hypothetical protein
VDSFRTKRGRCFISGSELRIEESYIDQSKRYYEEAKSSTRGLVLTGLMIVYVVWMANYILFDRREFFPYFLGFFVIIVVLANVVDHLRGFRRVDTLPLDSITAVEVIEGSWWTHPRFIIEYQNGDHINKRRVRLPSRYFAFTEQEFEHAKELFRSHDIPLIGDIDWSNGN